jgi:hypothetical protein
MLLAPSRWQIRCPRCGLSRLALDAGIVRLAPPKRKRTLAWCSGCHWLRFAVIEPMPEQGFEPIMTPPARGQASGKI